MTDLALADRLVLALGGRVDHEPGRTIITVPAALDAITVAAADPLTPTPAPTPAPTQNTAIS